MTVKSANAGLFTIPTAPAAGTSITSGAANVYSGSYVQLISSTAAAIFITGMQVNIASTSKPTYFNIQLGTGGAGSETIVGQIQGVIPSTAGATGTQAGIVIQIWPPIPVATTTRIAAKSADSVGTLAWLVSLQCINQANVVAEGTIKETVDVQTWLGGTIPAVNTTGVPLVDAKYVTGTLQTARDIGASVLLAAGQKVDVDTIKTNPVVNGGTVTFPTGMTLASTTNITAGTITTVTNLTNAPTAGDLTSTMKTSVTTAATAATPTAAAVTGAVGSVTGAVASVTGAVGSVTARVTANTDQWAGGTIPGPNVTGIPLVDLKYILGTVLTETAGQIAAAFKKFFNIATPASTMDALTLVATATNLTNAPTAGDLTATMKTSVTTAATAATPTAAAVTGAVGSVTGNVGGNVTGTVAGMTASGWATAFTVNSGKTFTDAISGSVVKEIATNASSGGSDPNIAAIKTVTDQLQFTAGGRLKTKTVNPAP